MARRRLLSLTSPFATDLTSSMTPASVQTAFLRALAEYELPDYVRVDVEIACKLLPDQVTSKFRRMISEVGPPDDLAT